MLSQKNKGGCDMTATTIEEQEEAHQGRDVGAKRHEAT